MNRRLFKEEGFTLVEMLVVLAILAILAAVSLPYAETTVKRDKELELKRDLREMRSAIDHFHYDWQDGTIPKTSNSASDDGYPKTLDILIQGAELSGARPVKQKYLRRIPENPWGDTSLPPDQQWGLRSYGDPADSSVWGGGDVYDIYCPGDAKALDGSLYHDW
ncbi:MAG TPA: type II secretion system protein [bacterium]|nr:type II secretion system protein [bacterium]